MLWREEIFKYPKMISIIGGDMMDIKELESLALKRISLSEVPAEFTGTVKKYEVRDDKRGRKSLFLTVEYNNGDVVIKYTPMHLSEFLEAVKKLGIRDLDDLVGKKVRFVAKAFRIGNPRHIPIKIEG